MNTLQKIEQILEEIRKVLELDGGDIQLISFENKILTLELQGACSTCAMSNITFGMILNNKIKDRCGNDVKEILYLNSINDGEISLYSK